MIRLLLVGVVLVLSGCSATPVGLTVAIAGLQYLASVNNVVATDPLHIFNPAQQCPIVPSQEVHP